MPFLVILIEHRYGAHQGMAVPGVWNWDKVQRFWSQFVPGHHLFYVHWGRRIISILRRNSFFSVLYSSLSPASSSPSIPSSFSFKYKYSGNGVGQWKKSLWEIKNPFSKIFRFFQDTLKLHYQRKVYLLWNCKTVVYCELWILVSEGLFLRNMWI